MATQSDWRFCNKCNEMFFDGYANKGHCPTGGGHQSQGYKFVLPHDIPHTSTGQQDWRFTEPTLCNWIKKNSIKTRRTLNAFN